ncbi:DUF1345 domain-containing protein [Arthrobacter cavernae]|uniref:DUF1345 domain-containing protein n=1 Tax=Arthrobacter cavernae TaxID=2817681 RepID=A0A939HM41_9MICC|nr:DUF1345 domain-containing protein [Arthrobacter cavernae]MBO1269813.1 DUF1345 domain-containing protein [Arthrobacter cavernae]
MPRPESVGRRINKLLVRLVELALVVIGVAFLLNSAGTAVDVNYLALWDGLALGYLFVGGLAVRRRRYDDTPQQPPDRSSSWLLRTLGGRRFSFLFTAAASLTGMCAALIVVVANPQDKYHDVLDFFAVVAITLAWVLFHAGYARFYGALYHSVGRGLQFPHTGTPHQIDLLYFAFTIGTTFAVSDVEVTTPEMRWHVTVHSVLSFYNTAVLALAIGIVTGK